MENSRRTSVIDKALTILIAVLVGNLGRNLGIISNTIYTTMVNNPSGTTIFINILVILVFIVVSVAVWDRFVNRH